MFPLPLMQAANQEVTVVTHGEIQAKLFWFPLFRWFKFTLKPPNSVTHGNLLWAIWDTSHWNFFVKFGLKTA